MQRLFAANGVRVDLELAAFFADHGDARSAVRLARRAPRNGRPCSRPIRWPGPFHPRRSHCRGAHTCPPALRLGTQSSRILYHAGIIELRWVETAAARLHLAQALA